MKSDPKLTVLIMACIFAAMVPFYAAAKDDKPKDTTQIKVKNENSWVLKKDKNGIKVFVRNVEGIDFKEFLGVTVIDAPIGVVDRVLCDVPNQVNWMCDIKEARVVKADPVNPIQYNVVTAPLVSDRDVVIQSNIVRSAKKILCAFRGITLDSVPAKKGIVRMPRMIGMWLLEAVGDRQTRVSYQNLADPGGSLPSGLVNLTVVKLPFITLVGLKSQVNNPKYNK